MKLKMRDNQKGKLWRKLSRPLLLAILLAGFIAIIYQSIVSFTSNFDTNDRIAITVLGGGLTETGLGPPRTQLRLDKAAELYEFFTKKGIKKCKIIPLSGGTPHKPNPVDSDGFPIWEATAAANQLIKMQIPPDAIYEESFSLDTIGNVRNFS